MSFNKILEKYRKISFSERDKGARFERLMQAYLLTDPQYAYRFKKVWMWDEFPGKNDLGSGDTGIDLVALTIDGDYWAIQCKCYHETSLIDKPAVDSFLSTSSRTFKNEDLKTVGFSHRLWISTTNKWGTNATQAIKNQHPPVSTIHLHDLQDAPVDWAQMESGVHGEIARITGRDLRDHQKEALDKTHMNFQIADRGKLIMACGTGKTFTSLRIAENETDGSGMILFLVPSISLLGQTLREWSTFAKEPINAICICSDPDISKKKTKDEDTDTFSTVDLALPASTDPEEILKQFNLFKRTNKPGMTVVFSTYQSIEVIAKAQKIILENGFSEFDMIICDEAHRTTGIKIAGFDESAFTKVHDNTFIKAKKRLYMTATPRLYNDEVKSKAAQAEAILCSMDDTNLYGEEIYRIGFGEAVEKDLLTDYKVLILTLNDYDIPPAVQKMIADENSEISTDDASKLIGCINALSKQVLGDEGIIKDSDPHPMKRAVAFCSNIKVSKKITETYNTASDSYIDSLPKEKRDTMVSIASKHIDGSMSAPDRDELLGWIKSDIEDGDCRILTNVRCLSEGVDVPSLDAVLFLSARNSQVDVVQSVGRVMRKSPGKKYGYIIIPVVVPSNIAAEKGLDDNERYKVVWTVLNALRAHDDRFNATVNKLELNNKRPTNVLVGGAPWGFDENGNPVRKDDSEETTKNNDLNDQMTLHFEELQNAIFARMVKKVGDKNYWEVWAKDVAQIAERYMERITKLVKTDGQHKIAFTNFLEGLQKNINPSIDENQAIEMLAQHIITKPVFEALFEGYSFVKNNAVSIAMQNMTAILEEQALEKDVDVLQKFYESVKMRAAGIDNAEGKQRIIIELYDKFFKTAFPKMVEQLGIVYTPVECVDFIIHSVNDILQKEFGRSLTDENVHILDPFTGTGTFITRLLQSGLIKEEDLERKYKYEIHANEIVLLAYYIAAVNIENAYHDATLDPDDGIGKEKYTPYDGICLTDTFQLGESDNSEKMFSEMFPQNSYRVAKQKKAPLRVIMGNPPYSVGQSSANDNAQNQSYPILDSRIANTYAKETIATNKNSLYDSYIKAFRWSADRLDKNGGIIAFISNGAWLDGNATSGFRKSLEREFSSIYVFNLRGNARTQGELRRKESGNVFGVGSRTPISITFLIKNPAVIQEKATVHYHDIGDYLTQQDKLKIITKFDSAFNEKMLWETLETNEHGDWINMRSDAFSTFIAMDDKSEKNTFWNSNLYCRGLETSRDAWLYQSNKNHLKENVSVSVNFYNSELHKLKKEKEINPKLDAKEFIKYDSSKISWSRAFINDIKNERHKVCDDTKIVKSLYRPFFKQFLYFSREQNNVVSRMDSFFPNSSMNNLVLCISGVGGTKDFTTIITNNIPDVQLQFNGQCFPLYYYEENNRSQKSIFDTNDTSDYLRRDGVSDFILERAKKQYGKNITKEDIFYYVYGFLHCPEYREMFTSDLKKMLPRLPLLEDVNDFFKFSKAGRELAELHINYETVPPFDAVEIKGAESEFYTVEKMRFPKKDQKDTIIYNSRISISNIPVTAYEYVVNGKSAIEWVMERYAVTTHKDSGIKNDPNDWAAEVGNPRYILDLILSIINVSVQTVDIVKGLPKVNFE
ncbi:DEAD/DEAH box helicase [Flavobacterium johnsoniae]|uniref:Predicted helicase n=1 Tax=Flavobacterium johnsoniae TaxID=986 RepID=A0A1M5Q6N7_FLAJO|nr:type ISP restriction/modification enzyme [Flavobacterium johnsoniae]SHH09668.1 Predicted helicase [Flavobacterium johnsoniae]